MNWVSGFLGRRSSTPQSLQYGVPNSQNSSKVDGIGYTSSCRNNQLVGQHSLDQSSFDRFKEYKKGPKRSWKLEPDYIFPDMIGTSSILTNDEIIFLDDEKPKTGRMYMGTCIFNRITRIFVGNPL